MIWGYHFHSWLRPPLVERDIVVLHKVLCLARNSKWRNVQEWKISSVFCQESLLNFLVKELVLVIYLVKLLPPWLKMLLTEYAKVFRYKTNKKFTVSELVN